MASERLVGGLTCEEVLSLLSAYVDGELEASALGRVQAHVKACETCKHFGGRYAKIVHCMRQKLADAEPLAPDIAARLEQCLRNAG